MDTTVRRDRKQERVDELRKAVRSILRELADLGEDLVEFTRPPSQVDDFEEASRRKKRRAGCSGPNTEGGQPEGAKKDFPALRTPKEKVRQDEMVTESNFFSENKYGTLKVNGQDELVPTKGNEKDNLEDNTKEKEIKPKRPPPITVRKTTSVQKVNSYLSKEGIALWRPHKYNNGNILIYPEEAMDYRKAVRIFQEEGVEFFTYQLKEEKEAKLVIKGVPTCFSSEEVKESLERKGFQVNRVSRIGPKDKPFPIMVVNVPKIDENKDIYKVKSVVNMTVTTEPKRRPTEARQCYNCQGFGHVQYRCNYKPKCFRCAGNHPSRECNVKDKDDKIKCTNCGGKHMASSWECENHPRRIKEKKEEERRRRWERAEVKEGTSYAKITRQKENDEQEETIRKCDIKDVINEALKEILPQIFALFNGSKN